MNEGDRMFQQIAWMLEKQVRKPVPNLEAYDAKKIAGSRQAGIYELKDSRDRRAFLTISEDGKARKWSMEYDPEYLSRGNNLKLLGDIQLTDEMLADSPAKPDSATDGFNLGTQLTALMQSICKSLGDIDDVSEAPLAVRKMYFHLNTDIRRGDIASMEQLKEAAIIMAESGGKMQKEPLSARDEQIVNEVIKRFFR